MRWNIALFGLILVLLFSSFASSTGSVSLPFTLQSGLAAHLGIVMAAPGASFRQEAEGDDILWRNNLYEVRLTPRFHNGITYLKLHVESIARDSLAITSVSLQVRAPSSGVAGVWTPSGRPDNDTLTSADAGTPFATQSAANYGIPYIAAADAFGDNSLALGLLQQDLPVDIRATPGGGFTELSLTANLSANGRTLDQEFFVSNAKAYSWYSAAEAYADWVDVQSKYSAFPISSRAFEPVYDTWYWTRDDVDDALYMNTAQAASESGLGAFLADSGWDAPAGEYDKWLLGRTGDYVPPHEKFRDLNATFDLLRSQFHLQIQLWMQPFAVGRNSHRYASTRALHIEVVKTADSANHAPSSLPLNGSNNLENVNLCPMVSGTHEYLRNLFTEMSRTYHPDAYWLDFIDGIPPYCVARHRHDFASFGDGLRQALETIRRTLLALEQNPVVQFRAQYANLNNKRFANVWQPFDSPNNYERMRLDTLRLRPFSKGVVFASDQLYWPSDTDDETVSRFLMASVMSGVPSVGANLLELKDSALDIVTNWMAFYRTYKDDLTAGRFRPFGPFRRPNHMIETNDRLFAYIRSNSRVVLAGGRKGEIFLMNASDRSRISATLSVVPDLAYEVQSFDRHVRPEGAASTVTATNRGVLDIDAMVEPGGYLKLTR